MIKHKKYTHTKGGKIKQFETDTLNKNKQRTSFILKLTDSTEQKFEISQHTFAHFDEFADSELNKQTDNFLDIWQFFVLFIFLLDSMNLNKIDLHNIKSCKTPNTCKIEKESTLLKSNKTNTKLNLYIQSPINVNNIFITSLFQHNTLRNVKDTTLTMTSINFYKNKSNSLHFELDTINNLLKNKDTIIKNNYNVNYIKGILFPNTNSIPSRPPRPTSNNPTSPTPPTSQIKTSNNQLFEVLEATYQFSIPKNSGGKKNKTYKNHKYKKHKDKKKKGDKDKGRKTRKGRKSI